MSLMHSTALDQFCGSTFWTTSLTWNTTNPQFTPCFEKTVLVWIPCGFLWIVALLELHYQRKSSNKDIPWNWKNISKFFVNALVCAVCLSDLITSAVKVDIYMSSCKFVTSCLALVLAYRNKICGVQSSGCLFIFWLLCSVFGAVQFSSELQRPQNYEYVSYMIYYTLVLAMLFLNCFGEGRPRVYPYGQAQNPSPEPEASFISRITFVFFDPFIYKGWKRPLEMKDMHDLNTECKAETIAPVFEAKFAKALERDTKEFNKKRQCNKEAGKTDVDNKKPDTSVMPILWSCLYSEFLLGVAMKFTNDLLQFVNPNLLGLVIGFVGSNQPLWKGILYAVTMFMASVLMTFLHSGFMGRFLNLGLLIKTILTSAIYRKSLRISNAARKNKTVGEIVNLMSNDAQKFQELVNFVNVLWSAPLSIVLAIVFLYRELGVAVFAGVAVMISLIPFNTFIVNRSKKLQVQQMKYKDERVKIMNEVLAGIRVLKLYAWEESFEKIIMNIRNKEIRTLRKAAYLNAGSSFLWNCAPFMVSCFTFATYVLIDEQNILTPTKAFVSLSLLNILRMPMSMLPNVINQVVQTWVSVRRINSFLNAEELEAYATHDEDKSKPITILDGTFTWGEEPILKNITLQVANGSLTAVVGAVGAGKSSLLSAILGEMDKLSGHVNTCGTIAYVPQQAWIQNATVEENITFGKTLDTVKYNKVIQACALQPDFDMLVNGDQTEIGEKGINLSGGQKQRVSLARAVYADADLYLLDDPLSAVDSHVGKHIFDNLLGPNGLLKDKTRVLNTHAITYLPQTNHIVVLKEGMVSEVGTYQELLAKKGAFADFVMQHVTEAVEDEEEQLVETPDVKDSQINLDQNASIMKLSTIDDKPKTRGKGKLIGEERAEKGNVKMDVFFHYLSALGAIYIMGNVIFRIGFQGFGIASTVWLGLWSEDENMIDINGTVDKHLRDMYLSVYGVLGVGQALSIMSGALIYATGTMIAATKLHNLMLNNVLRLPMSFFDTTPSGRILSRFSGDIIGIDTRLPGAFNVFFQDTLRIIGTIGVICYTTPPFIGVIVPLLALYVLIQRYYVATSRQLRRIESVSRSPIYSHFGETVSGTHVIRAYGQVDRFIQVSDDRVDAHQKSVYPTRSSRRWLSVRLEMLGNLIILSAALFAVIRTDLSPALVGLSVSYSMNITNTLNMLVRMVSDVEVTIVSVERIKEYSELKREADWDIPSKKPPISWPDMGVVEFKDYSVRYRPGLDLVLHGVDFHVQGGEKVGIVGRTGAGKSSLTLSLFRIIEAAAGQIMIDGKNIADMGLHDVRSRLTIIPQDAVLFSGTLRINLDPFDRHSDGEVWKALELAHLKNYVQGLSAGLSHNVSEGGDNLSGGQRQLICLARALLRKSKILILDEATAAVDLETDDLIQKTIRTAFADCTVLTIAHRLNTIMDSDRVLVLDKGNIAEFDTPASLLGRNSIFYGMCKDANLVS